MPDILHKLLHSMVRRVSHVIRSHDYPTKFNIKVLFARIIIKLFLSNFVNFKETIIVRLQKSVHDILIQRYIITYIFYS